MSTRKPLMLGALATAGTVALSGCSFDGLNSMPVPFAAGTGSDSYQITAEMADVGNLVPNAEVKVDDVTVGTVRGIQFDNWHAKLTIALEPSVQLPANAEIRVGQKSLLGAEYLELDRPSHAAPTGQLKAGDVIPLSRTGKYPETEDLLAALSALLNGGGLEQIDTINREINNALGGRESDTRKLLSDLDTFVGTLNSQRDDISRTIDSLDNFSGKLAAQNQRFASAIDAIGPGLKALEANRPALTQTLQASSNLSTVATRVISETQDNLLANLKQLRPVMSQLTTGGDDFVQALSQAGTLIFPLNTLDQVFRGDYANLFGTFDITLPTLDGGMFTGTPLGGVPTKLTQSLAQLVNPGDPESPGMMQNLAPPNTSLVGPNPPQSPPGPDNPANPAPAPSDGSGPPPPPKQPCSQTGQISGLFATLTGQGGC